MIKKILKDKSFGLIPEVEITLLLTLFITTTYGFGLYLFSAIVADMRADLGFSYTTAGILSAAAQIVFIVFALGGAAVSARIGGVRVVLGSVGICGVCLLLLPMSSNIWLIGFCLALMGGCCASVFVPMVEIVSHTIAFEHRGKVMGLISSGTSYGVFINSILIPVFVLRGNWQGVWTTVGIITISVFVIAYFVFKRLGLLDKSSVEELESHDFPDEGGKGLLGVSKEVFVPWVFIVWSITFLNGFSTLPFQTYLSPYLREELGVSVIEASQVWGILGAMGMVSGFIVGWMSDRTSIRLALIFTYSCILISVLLMLIDPARVTLLMAGGLFGFAFYPIFGLVPAYIAKKAKGSNATVIFGVASVMVGLGAMSGNFLGGLSQTQTETFFWVYSAIAATLVLLVLLTSVLPNEKNSNG